MVNTETIWYGTSELSKLSANLQKRLIPVSGEAMTIHGEIMRQLAPIYYDRNNNGFGNGPFKDAFNFVASHFDKLAPFMSKKAFEDFKWDFECIEFGADQVESGWEGDAGLEMLVTAAVKFADQCEKESPTDYRDVSDIVADLSSGDRVKVSKAIPVARKVLLRSDTSQDLRDAISNATFDALQQALVA